MTPLTAAVLAHIREKWPRGCPMCGSKKFTSPMRVDLIVGDAMIIQAWAGPATTLPCAALSCRACGFTLLINAYLAGLTGVIDQADDD